MYVIGSMLGFAGLEAYWQMDSPTARGKIYTLLAEHLIANNES